MKPTAPDRYKSRVFATTPCRGLSLSRFDELRHGHALGEAAHRNADVWMSLSAQGKADETAALLAKYNAEFNERLNKVSEARSGKGRNGKF
jgi:hypothetical protein